MPAKGLEKGWKRAGKKRKFKEKQGQISGDCKGLYDKKCKKIVYKLTI